MRGHQVAVVAVLFMAAIAAGCSGKQAETVGLSTAEATVSKGDNNSISAPPVTMPSPKTDRLYLALPPAMGVGRPTNGTASLTIYGTPGSFGTFWNYTFQANATITHVQSQVWIRVPTQFVMSDSLAFHLGRNGQPSLFSGYWAPIPPIVPAGDYAVTFNGAPYADQDNHFKSGDVVFASFGTQGVAASVAPPFEILYGAAWPSQVQLGGAAEPT